MKIKYIITFIIAVIVYFIFSDMGFYLAHNMGAALVALLLSPGLVAIFLPAPEIILTILIVFLNMLYYLLLHKLYKLLKTIRN